MQKRRKSLSGKIVGGIAVLVVLVVIGYVSGVLGAAQFAQAGSCIVLVDQRMEPTEGRVVDCAEQGVVTHLVASSGARPEGAATETLCPSSAYGVFMGTRLDDPQADLDRQFFACLLPNLEAGRCYLHTERMAQHPVSLRESPCATTGSVKVAAVYDRSGATCAKGQRAVSFPEPARTYCLAAQQA